MQRMMLLVLQWKNNGNFTLFWISELQALPANIYPLICCFTKWVFPHFFKCQPFFPSPEPDFDLQALQSSHTDKSVFRDDHTCSCLKIPHLVISYHISCISRSLTVSFARNWYSSCFSMQSTAELVLQWLHDCNACTLLPFLPLLTSTALHPGFCLVLVFFFLFCFSIFLFAVQLEYWLLISRSVLSLFLCWFSDSLALYFPRLQVTKSAQQLELWVHFNLDTCLSNCF